jgi:hypothetical protein
MSALVLSIVRSFSKLYLDAVEYKQKVRGNTVQLLIYGRPVKSAWLRNPGTVERCAEDCECLN